MIRASLSLCNHACQARKKRPNAVDCFLFEQNKLQISENYAVYTMKSRFPFRNIDCLIITEVIEFQKKKMEATKNTTNGKKTEG